MPQNTSKLAVVAAASSLAPISGAAIISADFSSSPITIGSSDVIYVDFETATASSSFTPGSDADLFFAFGFQEKPAVQTSGSWGANTTGSYVQKLAFNDPIQPSGSGGLYLESVGGGSWGAPNDGLGYLGLHNSSTGSQAWLYIDYNDAANTLTLLGVGYNPDGTLAAGEVSVIPEPASAALMAALLAGGSAAFQRRRRAA